MTVARGSPTMSAETSGSSDTPRIPWYCSDEASCRNASLTSCTVVGRFGTNTMSAIDPTGIGARTAIPSNLPTSSGTARVVARAAPVEVGTRLTVAAQEVLAGTIDEPLAAGVGVDGRHHRALHTDVAVGDFDNRGDAVGGAAGAGNDLCRTVGMVHAVYHGWHCLRRRRRRKDHERGTGLNVLLQIVLGFEDAGAFQHQVDAEVGPRQVRRVTFGERRDPPTVDH